MPPEVHPITSPQAADLLDRAPATIRYWVTHFAARRVGRVGKVMYYDYNDLAIIERELRHGHPVPPTPELRAEIRSRCPLQAAEQVKHAA